MINKSKFKKQYDTEQEQWENIYSETPNDTIDIYLASSAINKMLIQTIADLLPLYDKDIKITSLWHNSKPMSGAKELAEMDITNGVEKSDILIAFYPYGEQGTITELTSAYYMDKRIIYCRAKEVADKDPMITGLFHNNNRKCYIVETIHALFFILMALKKEILTEKEKIDD